MKAFKIFALGFLLMAFQCEKDENCPSDDVHNGLKVENQSNIRIRYNIYWNYPDTNIGKYNPVNNGTKRCFGSVILIFNFDLERNCSKIYKYLSPVNQEVLGKISAQT